MKPCAGMKTEIIRLGGGSPIYVKENHRQPKGNKSVILLITFYDAENHLEQPGITLLVTNECRICCMRHKILKYVLKKINLKYNNNIILF